MHFCIYVFKKTTFLFLTTGTELWPFQRPECKHYIVAYFKNVLSRSDKYSFILSTIVLVNFNRIRRKIKKGCYMLSCQIVDSGCLKINFTHWMKYVIEFDNGRCAMKAADIFKKMSTAQNLYAYGSPYN